MGVRWRILRLMRGDGVTFGGVGGFVFAPVAEDFVFDPRHVGVVVGIVLFLCPLHDLLLLWVFCLLGTCEWRPSDSVCVG